VCGSIAAKKLKNTGTVLRLFVLLLTYRVFEEYRDVVDKSGKHDEQDSAFYTP